MGLRNSLKWTLAYRTVSVGALVLGLALVAAGFVVGFGDALSTLVSDPVNPGSAIERANPTITLIFAAGGIVVWQLGKTLALFVTLPRAAGRAAGRQLDANRLASEVQDGLDDRLADIEAELAETRRALEALEDDDRTATFDEREHLEDDAATETEPSPPSSPNHAASTDDGDGSADGGDGSSDDGDGSAEVVDRSPDGGEGSSDGGDPLA